MRHVLFALCCCPLIVFAKPNILLVYVDDLGYGDLGSYGHPIVTTPHIDQLANEGARFTQFYAPSALCSPSRAGLLTGRTPYRTGIKSWIPDDSAVQLDKDEFTLADLLKSAGYRTAVIGKWHLNGGLGMASVSQPRDLGFDYQYGLGAWVKNEEAEAAGEGRLYPDNMYRNNQPVGKTTKFSAELVSDEAITWLSSGQEPFFLLLTYSEVHTPVASPDSHVHQYSEFLTDEARQHPLRYYMDWGSHPSRGKGEYYANISFLDEQLGRVISHLKKTQQIANTLIVFTSDNGPVTSEAAVPWEVSMAGETDGLRGKKRYLFEGGIRVPGIITWPKKIPAGLVVDEPVTALDLLPTIAGWTNQKLPSDLVVDGEDVGLLMDGNSATSFRRENPLVWAIPTPDNLEFAIRDGTWKLLMDSQKQPVYLFNLESDRYEIVNQLKREPALAKQLQQKFEAFWRSVE